LYPSSEPTESLFHWLESQGHFPGTRPHRTVTAADQIADAEQISPYVSDFSRSQSLDFSALELEGF
jgi:hypothetical protein